MLYLTKEASNTLILRLSDLIEPMPSSYEFVFTHEQQKKPLSVVLTDISDYPYRYSKFTLVLPTDLPNMTQTGEYSFVVKHNSETIYKGKSVLKTTPLVSKTNPLTNENNKIYNG